MNQYELAVIFDPGLELDLDKATAKAEKIIAEAGGKIINTDNWGKRKLAYPINKQEHGIYVFYILELPTDGPRKLERVLNITDEIIRFMITRPDLKAAAKAEALKTEKAAKAAANPGVSDDDEKADKEAEPRQYRRGKTVEPSKVEKPAESESEEK